MNPLIRAKRILISMDRFREGFKNGFPDYASCIPVADREQLIGVYENHLAEITASIAVTDFRLLVERDGEWVSLPYSEIAAIETPEPAAVDESAPVLKVRLKSGTYTTLAIHGRRGSFLDLYEFSRFLMRVREDAQRESAGNEA